MSDSHFYVQEARRAPWHVESDEDCEVMLCGMRIPVEGPGTSQVNISTAPGARQCPDCWLLLYIQHRIEALAPHRVERSRIPSRYPMS